MTKSAKDILADAVSEMEKGAYGKALELAQAALQSSPDNADALHLIGILYAMAGQHELAERHMKLSLEACNKANSLNPQYITNYALLLQPLGRLAETETQLKFLLQHMPEDPLANMLYGQILAARNEPEKALPHLLKAANTKGSGAEACYRLGQVYSQLGDNENAETYLSAAVDREPGNTVAHNNYGQFLLEQGQAEHAARHFQKALEHTTENLAELRYNLGNAQMALKDYKAAEASYQEAISKKPDMPEAHAHLGFSLLAQGRYPEGFSEYAWRFKAEGFPTQLPAGPLWAGENLRGKTILLIAEQGFGDAFQFIRYAALVKDRGANIILQAPPALNALVAAIPGIDAVVNQGDQLPPYDYMAPLMSLPGILETTPATIPADVPYLSAPDDKVSDWQKRLRDFDGLKIGMVWMGNPDQRKNKFRSCPLEALTPLTKLANIQMFSLQKHAKGDPLNLPPDIVDLGQEFEDFSDTAAAIANMDLVISVCTSVAHLTGALGKPLWVMLAYAPDWRWQLEEETTPWYPTARLFRQQSPGDWAGVVERVALALKDFDPA